MSQQINDSKPLFLSAEEAMGLLDLCMLSHAEFDREKECALLKLSDLVRQHLSDENSAACAGARGEGDNSRLGSVEPVYESLRHAEMSRLSLAGAELGRGFKGAARRPALKPCPAGSFRFSTAAPGP